MIKDNGWKSHIFVSKSSILHFLVVLDTLLMLQYWWYMTYLIYFLFHFLPMKFTKKGTFFKLSLKKTNTRLVNPIWTCFITCFFFVPTTNPKAWVVIFTTDVATVALSSVDDPSFFPWGSDYFFCSYSSSCHYNCTRWWMIRFTFRFNNNDIHGFPHSSKMAQFLSLLCTSFELQPLLPEIKLKVNRKANIKLKN